MSDLGNPENKGFETYENRVKQAYYLIRMEIPPPLT